MYHEIHYVFFHDSCECFDEDPKNESEESSARISAFVEEVLEGLRHRFCKAFSVRLGVEAEQFGVPISVSLDGVFRCHGNTCWAKAVSVGRLSRLRGIAPILPRAFFGRGLRSCNTRGVRHPSMGLSFCHFRGLIRHRSCDRWNRRVCRGPSSLFPASRPGLLS